MWIRVFSQLLHLLRGLAEAKVFIIQVLGSTSLGNAALDTEDNVLENVVLDDVLKAV